MHKVLTLFFVYTDTLTFELTSPTSWHSAWATRATSTLPVEVGLLGPEGQQQRKKKSPHGLLCSVGGLRRPGVWSVYAFYIRHALAKKTEIIRSRGQNPRVLPSEGNALLTELESHSAAYLFSFWLCASAGGMEHIPQSIQVMLIRAFSCKMKRNPSPWKGTKTLVSHFLSECSTLR